MAHDPSKSIHSGDLLNVIWYENALCRGVLYTTGSTRSLGDTREYQTDIVLY